MNRARYYDPALGRFVSRDPIGYRAGDPSLYRYVKNSPTFATDPSGHVIRHIQGTPAQRARFDRLLSQIADLVFDRTGLSVACAAARRALDPDITIRVNWKPDANPFVPHGHEALQIELNSRTHTYLQPDYDVNQTGLGFEGLTEDEIAQIVIAHELGHAIPRLRFTDPTTNNPNGGNVTICENPYREVLRRRPLPQVQPRTSYDGTTVPSLGNVNRDERRRATRFAADNYPDWNPPHLLELPEITDIVPPDVGLSHQEMMDIMRPPDLNGR